MVGTKRPVARLNEKALNLKETRAVTSVAGVVSTVTPTVAVAVPPRPSEMV